MKASARFSWQGLRAKLAVLTLLPLTLLAILTVISIIGGKIVDRNLQNTGSVQAPLVRLTGEMQSSLSNVQRWIWVVYLNDENLLERSLPPKKVREEISRYESAKAEYLKIPRSAKERELFDALNESWSNLGPIVDAVVDAYEKTEGHKDAPERVQINKKLHSAFGAVLSVFESVNSGFEQMAHARFEDLSSQVKETLKSSNQTRWISLMLTLLGSIISLVVGWKISLTLNRALLSIAQDINGASESLRTESSGLAIAGKKLASGSQSTGISLQETVSATTQISTTISRNSEHSSNAAGVAQKSHQTASHGDAAVQQMIRVMGEIDAGNSAILKSVNESNQQTAGLVSMINEIKSKTQVINDIVFQTKLLSFNASVEAARAGEHGKGFAVVAEEVGALAKSSGDAAKQIEELLARSSTRVSNLVKESDQKVRDVVESSQKAITDGGTVAEDCSKILKELVAYTSTLAGLAQSVSTATQDQANGVREISQAMGHLDELTQQNSVTSKQVSEASHGVAKRALVLENLSFRLNELIHGKSGEKKAAGATEHAAEELPAELDLAG